MKIRNRTKVSTLEFLFVEILKYSIESFSKIKCLMLKIFVKYKYLKKCLIIYNDSICSWSWIKIEVKWKENWLDLRKREIGKKRCWFLMKKKKEEEKVEIRNRINSCKLARINLKLRWYKIINNSLNKYVSTWSIRNNYNRSKRVKKSSLVSTRNSIVELLSITFHNYTTRLVLLHRYSQESECFPRRTKIRGQRKLVLAILSPLNTP